LVVLLAFGISVTMGVRVTFDTSQDEEGVSVDWDGNQAGLMIDVGQRWRSLWVGHGADHEQRRTPLSISVRDQVFTINADGDLYETFYDDEGEASLRGSGILLRRGDSSASSTGTSVSLAWKLEGLVPFAHYDIVVLTGVNPEHSVITCAEDRCDNLDSLGLIDAEGDGNLASLAASAAGTLSGTMRLPAFVREGRIAGFAWELQSVVEDILGSECRFRDATWRLQQFHGCYPPSRGGLIIPGVLRGQLADGQYGTFRDDLRAGGSLSAMMIDESGASPECYILEATMGGRTTDMASLEDVEGAKYCLGHDPSQADLFYTTFEATVAPCNRPEHTLLRLRNKPDQVVAVGNGATFNSHSIGLSVYVDVEMVRELPGADLSGRRLRATPDRGEWSYPPSLVVDLGLCNLLIPPDHVSHEEVCGDVEGAAKAVISGVRIAVTCEAVGSSVVPYVALPTGANTNVVKHGGYSSGTHAYYGERVTRYTKIPLFFDENGSPYLPTLGSGHGVFPSDTSLEIRAMLKYASLTPNTNAALSMGYIPYGIAECCTDDPECGFSDVDLTGTGLAILHEKTNYITVGWNPHGETLVATEQHSVQVGGGFCGGRYTENGKLYVTAAS